MLKILSALKIPPNVFTKNWTHTYRSSTTESECLSLVHRLLIHSFYNSVHICILPTGTKFNNFLTHLLIVSEVFYLVFKYFVKAMALKTMYVLDF